MSTSIGKQNDDFTTDACPSPPRDSGDDEKSDQNEAETEADTRPTKPNRRPKQGSCEPPPKNTHAPHPAAISTSVINISNSTGIHIGSNFNVFLNKQKQQQQQQQQQKSKKEDILINDSIRSLLTSTSPVSKQQISMISSHLNENWRDTARKLNYSDGQISQFYEDYNSSGIKEVIYQLLLDWIQNEADGATVGKLSKALWESNQKDTVQRWAGNFPKSP